MLNYTKHYIDEDDIQAVVKCLRSERITQGLLVDEFERRIADTVKTRYAVVFNSGTAALHAAYQAVGLDKGKRIVTSPITFMATANAAVYRGADVDYVDIDPKTYCMSPERLKEYVYENDPYIIVPVHMGGKMCDMESIMEIADDVWVVEDACHAFSLYFRLRGHMAVFSFHPAKHITTGEGGAVVTNSPYHYVLLKSLRDHGRINGQAAILGYNYRLPDMNCALGISQLKKIGQWQNRRTEIAHQYTKVLQGIVQTPVCINNAFHLYVIRVKNRDEVKCRLAERGVGTQIHYPPVYHFHKAMWWSTRCPEAERYAEECLSLPMYPTMTDEEVQHVITSVKEAVR